MHVGSHHYMSKVGADVYAGLLMGNYESASHSWSPVCRLQYPLQIRLSSRHRWSMSNMGLYIELEGFQCLEKGESNDVL